MVETYSAIRHAVEALGPSLNPPTVRKVAAVCTQALKTKVFVRCHTQRACIILHRCQESWPTRKQAALTVAALAAAMATADPKLTAGLVELAAQRPGLVEALDSVKYDKIAQVGHFKDSQSLRGCCMCTGQVREAVTKALAALAALPDDVLDGDSQGASTDAPSAASAAEVQGGQQAVVTPIAGTPKSIVGTPKSVAGTPKSIAGTPKAASSMQQPKAASRMQAKTASSTPDTASKRATTTAPSTATPVEPAAQDESKRSRGMSLSKALGLSKLKGAFSRDSSAKSVTSRCEMHSRSVDNTHVAFHSENEGSNGAGGPATTPAQQQSVAANSPAADTDDRATRPRVPRQPLSRHRGQGGGNYDVAVEVFEPPRPKPSEESLNLSPMMLQQIQQQAYLQVGSCL